MNRLLCVLLAIAVTGSFYGCKKENPPPANSASVMFVNGCAGTTPGIDAKVDGINVTGAANIPFTGQSGYKFVKSGTAVNIAYFITNSGTPVTDENVAIDPSNHYTAFSSGLITAPNFVFVKDDMTLPAASSAKVRFANLSNDGMSVTATIQNTVIDSNVTSQVVTGYLEMPAGTYELKAGDPDNINTVVTTGTTTLAAGKIYTLMLTGALSGTGTSALKLTLVNHN